MNTGSKMYHVTKVVDMKTAYIYARPLKNELLADVVSFVHDLEQRGVTVVVYHKLWQAIKKYFPNEKPVFTSQDTLEGSNSVFITLGGDGTFLDALKYVYSLNIPVFGVNFGRLGFLAGVGGQQLQLAAQALCKGDYIIEKRTVLQFNPHLALGSNFNYALNECAIFKKDTASMVSIKVYINDFYLNTYWADGLIISTPTGSTGYSLSCGGPIILPGSGNLVITPIAPHNLNVRPIVIPDQSVIKLTIENREKKLVASLDARSHSLDPNTQITLMRAPNTLQLINLSKDYFIQALRSKLMWGIDPRNYNG